MHREYGRFPTRPHGADFQPVDCGRQILLDPRKRGFRMATAHNPQGRRLLGQVRSNIGRAPDPDAQYGGRANRSGPGGGNISIDDRFFDPDESVREGNHPVSGQARHSLSMDKSRLLRVPSRAFFETAKLSFSMAFSKARRTSGEMWQDPFLIVLNMASCKIFSVIIFAPSMIPSPVGVGLGSDSFGLGDHLHAHLIHCIIDHLSVQDCRPFPLGSGFLVPLNHPSAEDDFFIRR